MQQDSYINLSSIFLVEKKTICKFSINEISTFSFPSSNSLSKCLPHN